MGERRSPFLRPIRRKPGAMHSAWGEKRMAWRRIWRVRGWPPNQSSGAKPRPARSNTGIPMHQDAKVAWSSTTERWLIGNFPGLVSKGGSGSGSEEGRRSIDPCSAERELGKGNLEAGASLATGCRQNRGQTWTNRLSIISALLRILTARGPQSPTRVAPDAGACKRGPEVETPRLLLGGARGELMTTYCVAGARL